MFRLTRKTHLFLLLIQTICLLPVITAFCNQSCGSNPAAILLPSPIGFSSGCKIHLKCGPNSTIFIGEFPVQSIDSSTIKVIIQAKCSRPLSTIRQLFSPNFSPTLRNAILLQNCSLEVSNCMLPATIVTTRFEAPNCSVVNDSISCYSGSSPNVSEGYMDFDSVMRSGCRNLLSSISADNSSVLVSLEVQTVEIGWWLKGTCDCDQNADCIEVLLPSNGTRLGYRCQCFGGFSGDGYSAGTGCRKDSSSHCNFSKYLHGECGQGTKIIIPIASIAAGVLIVSLGLICWFIRQKRRSRMKFQRITKRQLSEATGSCRIPIYAYKEIEKATNSFSEKQRLGTGAYGTVYSAKLHSDEWVAIKRIRNRDTDGIDQVMNEIKLISSVNHPNLVRLLGCSIDYGEQILVYEFMPNGTLSQHLQREIGDGLVWSIRVAIVTETARAIAHLHSSITPPIFHRDVKSNNILLDYDFKSKVADFGLSRLGMTEISHISTAPQGTPGYLDPQYHQDFHLSDRSDVYSFGVVLLEIITALKVVDFCRQANEVNLAALALDRISNGRLDEIIDPFLKLNQDAWTLLTLPRVAELAFRCLAFHRDMRPSMLEVAAELEQIGETKLASSEPDRIRSFSDVCNTRSFSSNMSQTLLSEPRKSALESCKAPFHVQSDADDSLKPEESKVKDSSPVSVQDPWLSEHSL